MLLVHHILFLLSQILGTFCPCFPNNITYSCWVSDLSYLMVKNSKYVPHNQKHAGSLQLQIPNTCGSPQNLGSLFSLNSVKTHCSSYSLPAFISRSTQQFFVFNMSSMSTCICSLTFMIRMSSEVCQLCLEALTPLAEQCAKAQDTDSPLFLATRHFLKVRCLDSRL